jgi:hypothetical protein
MPRFGEIETWKHWVEASQQSGHLTKWEESFLESVSEQIEEHGSLSERQAEILERIYVEKSR